MKTKQENKKVKPIATIEREHSVTRLAIEQVVNANEILTHSMTVSGRVNIGAFKPMPYRAWLALYVIPNIDEWMDGEYLPEDFELYEGFKGNKMIRSFYNERVEEAYESLTELAGMAQVTEISTSGKTLIAKHRNHPVASYINDLQNAYIAKVYKSWLAKGICDYKELSVFFGNEDWKFNKSLVSKMFSYCGLKPKKITVKIARNKETEVTEKLTDEVKFARIRSHISRAHKNAGKREAATSNDL